MICLICRQAEIIGGLRSVSFQRGEMHLMINNVPAHICPSCGEAYVGEEVAVRRRMVVLELGYVLEQQLDYDKDERQTDCHPQVHSRFGEIIHFQ